ncbi:hypothetical protein JW823_06830 [bacterium]|nr:hypothetical protein [candidate division CSSED10-310 bacterium]
MFIDSRERDDNDQFHIVKSLIIARLLIGTTLLLGTAIPLEVTGFYSVSRFLFPLVITILVMTIIYSGLLNILSNICTLAYIQLIGDILLATVIIMATGGIESPFSILFVVTVIVASYLIEKSGAFIIATLISISFGSLVFCQYHGWTTWWPVKTTGVLLPPPTFAIYIILVNLIGYYLTAILATSLSKRIRKMNILLKTRNVQFNYLWNLNRRVVNEIHSGLITMTKDGEILSVNPAAKKLLRFPQELQDVVRLEHVFPDYLVQSILRIAEMDQNVKRQINYQIEHGDDATWLTIDVIILQRMERDPARLMLILNDVTDFKKLEEVKRKAQRWSTVSEVSAGMAHEIRNPLASISGSIEVLRDQLQLNDNQSRLMSIIIRESERLNKLITDFLDLSRPRRPEFSLVDVIAVLSEITILIKTCEAYKESIQIKFEKDEDHIEVELDKDQFAQVAWNLVKNALEAMPEGGVLTIRAEIKRQADVSKKILDFQPKPPFFRLTVEDTGVGMTQEVISRIFDPFITFKRKGVGIGLAIVYRIAENHNAAIRVSSTPRKGASFIIDFPSRQPESGTFEDLGAKGENRV